MNSIFKSYLQPELTDPYLLCGLPDMGFAAKQVGDYLIEKFKAELFEEIFSPHFPAHVIITQEGIVELMKNELFYWKRDNLKNDLILLTGNAQAISPEGQYELVDEILSRMKKLNVKKIITIAPNIVSDRAQNETPKIHGVVNNSNLIDTLKEYEIPLLEKGSVRGFNGLLLGMAKLEKIEGICLVPDTLDYITISGHLLADAKAAKAALEILSKMLKIKVDMTDMDKQAKSTEEFIQKLEDAEKQTLEEISKSELSRKQQYYI